MTGEDGPNRKTHRPWGTAFADATRLCSLHPDTSPTSSGERHR